MIGFRRGLRLRSRIAKRGVAGLNPQDLANLEELVAGLLARFGLAAALRALAPAAAPEAGS